MKKVYKPQTSVKASSGIESSDYLIRMGYPGDRENAATLKEYINDVVDKMDWSVKQIQDALDGVSIDDMDIEVTVDNMEDSGYRSGCCVNFITNLSDIRTQIVNEIDSYFYHLIDAIAMEFDDNQTTTDVYSGEENVTSIYFYKK